MSTRWRAALADVVARHESLRTLFVAPEGTPQQVVIPVERADFGWDVVDAEWVVGGPAATRPSRSRQRDTFDLATDIPLRAHAFPRRRRRARAGGRGAPHRRRRLVAAAAGRRSGRGVCQPVRGPGPGLGAAGGAVRRLHAVAARAVRSSRRQRQPRSPRSWPTGRTRWPGCRSGLQLPTDRPYPLVADQRGATVDVQWPAELQQQVARVAREHNATSFMVMQAALAVLLSKISASSDVAVGFPIAGRRDPALDDLVGLLRQHLGAAGRLGRRSQFRRAVGARSGRAAWRPSSTRTCPSRCWWSGSTPPAA